MKRFISLNEIDFAIIVAYQDYFKCSVYTFYQNIYYYCQMVSGGPSMAPTDESQ